MGTAFKNKHLGRPNKSLLRRGRAVLKIRAIVVIFKIVFFNFFLFDRLVRPQGVLGSIPGSEKVLLGFSIKDFSVTVTESRFVPG